MVDQVPTNCLPARNNSISSESGIYFGGENETVAIMLDEFYRLAKVLSEKTCEPKVVSIFGMAGIGKTTLVKKIYDHPYLTNYFGCRAFVTVGQNCSLLDVLKNLLVSIDPNSSCIMSQQSVEELKLCLNRLLRGNRYLIILDDVWDREIWYELWRYFPKDTRKSRIFVTTRIEGVALDISPLSTHYVRFLKEVESRYLLRMVVFEEDSCPDELEKIGRRIAEKCEGLPLVIVAVGRVLAEMEKTPSNWREVEKRMRNSMVTHGEDEDHVSERLLLSFKQLPQVLKPCFLYMGVFEKMNDISASKLIKLWAAEGFLELDPSKTLEFIANEWLEKLVSRTLVLPRRQGSSGGIKTCSVHYAFRHLCRREAEKDKFFHIMNSYVISFREDMQSQCRLCIHKHALLGLKDMNNLMQSVRNLHSVICTGPNHPYPTRIPLNNMTLLRVLDALTIRFYQFPDDVLNLVLLRYLTFTSSGGEIPASISKLCNLEYLIVHPYQRIISPGRAPSYLPMEIWNMKQLTHLEVMGSDMPTPLDVNALLPNLFTLSGVSAHSCTKQVIQKLPNLKKLGVHDIVFALDDTSTFHVFDHLSLLSQLESFKYVVSNLHTKSPVHLPPHSSINIFPSSLRKLTLSGCRFAWKDMKRIGVSVLPNLEVLKLRLYAFQGAVWKANEGEFQMLKCLVLEDLDLDCWVVDHATSFPMLQRLIIRDCYYLRKIPRAIGKISNLTSGMLDDCNPSVEVSAWQIQMDRYLSGNQTMLWHLHYSWKDPKRMNWTDCPSPEDVEEAHPFPRNWPFWELTPV